MKRFGYETLGASISEMSTDVTGGDIDIQLDDRVKKLVERDKDPMFVTLQVAREGVSRNGRFYSAKTMQEIADQINSKQPDGYKGHLTKKERETKAPDAETIWLGAKVSKDKDGKTCVYAKGYVLPYATKRRTYLQTAFDLGKNVAVSIFGGAEKATYNSKQKAYDIEGLTLESVDWARPGSEGIPNDGTLILTTEMINNNPKEGDDMTLEEALKSAKAEDLRTHNPTLVSEIESNATKDKIDISEMTAVQEAVGAESADKAVEAIAEMKTKLNGFELNAEVDARVQVKSARQVIRKMALSEMKADESAKDAVERVLQTDQAKAIIKEMTGTPKVNPTNDDRSQPTARKFTTARR